MKKFLTITASAIALSMAGSALAQETVETERPAQSDAPAAPLDDADSYFDGTAMTSGNQSYITQYSDGNDADVDQSNSTGGNGYAEIVQGTPSGGAGGNSASVDQSGSGANNALIEQKSTARSNVQTSKAKGKQQHSSNSST